MLTGNGSDRGVKVLRGVLMALPCGTFVVRRPCRKKPRLFTDRDVARIARDAGERQDPKLIIAAVLVAFGFGSLICVAARNYDRFTQILRVVREIAAVLAGGTLIRIIINWILSSPLSKVRLLNWIVAIIIALLVLIEKLLANAAAVERDLIRLENAIQLLKDVCEFVDIIEDNPVDTGERRDAE